MSTPPIPGKTELTYISVYDTPSQIAGRTGKIDLLVTYELDPLHRFQFYMPKEGATPQLIDAKIKEDFATHKELIGRKVTY